MLERITRPILLAGYQLSLLVGIVLLPLAVVIGRLGVTLPIHRLVETLAGALDRSEDVRP